MNQKPESQIISQAIALAAIAQSINCLQKVAWKGDCNQDDLKTVIGSLLKVTAPSTAAIYNGTFELSNGLRFLKQQLESPNKDPEFINLMLNVIMLQKTVSKKSSLMNSLTSKIEQLSQKFSDDTYLDDEGIFSDLVAECSAIYQQTLSTMPRRIQVKGEPNCLKQEKNQILVRASLLAAIRACFLWRQVGGSRWDFFLRKNKLIEALGYIVSNPIAAD